MEINILQNLVHNFLKFTICSTFNIGRLSKPLQLITYGNFDAFFVRLGHMPVEKIALNS